MDQVQDQTKARNLDYHITDLLPQSEDVTVMANPEARIHCGLLFIYWLLFFVLVISRIKLRSVPRQD
jgi:hypothetical protein